MDQPKPKIINCFKLAFLGLLLLNITGCASQKFFIDLFANGDRVFIDKETGMEFLVSHHFGDNYTIRRMPDWASDIGGSNEPETKAKR